MKGALMNFELRLMSGKKRTKMTVVTLCGGRDGPWDQVSRTLAEGTERYEELTASHDCCYMDAKFELMRPGGLGDEISNSLLLLLKRVCVVE